jgi:hypothetical protein
MEKAGRLTAPRCRGRLMASALAIAARDCSSLKSRMEQEP